MLSRKARRKSAGRRARPLWHDWLWIDVIAGELLVLFVLLVAVFGYGMRYPKLSFSQNLLQNVILILLLLPFPIGVIGLAARESGKRGTCRLCTVLGFPSLLAALVSAGIMVFLPPFCSSTSRQKDYLKFDVLDSSVTDGIELLFPAQIPPEAGDVNYRYYKYASALERTVHVTLGMTLSETEFAAERERVLSLTMLEGAEISGSKGITLINGAEQPEGLEYHVTLDEDYRRVIFTAAWRKAR